MIERDGENLPRRMAISRRRFLAESATLAAVAGGWSFCRAGEAKKVAAAPLGRRSRVVQASSSRMVTPLGIHEGVLSDLLEATLVRLTGAQDGRSAWRSLLDADDVIGLKFDASGEMSRRTTGPMLRTLVKSLTDAGFDSQQLVAIDVPDALRAVTKTVAPERGWSVEATDFGGGQDRLAMWLDQVTALINVPLLTDHNICGISGALWNLAHSVVKHPARLYSPHGVLSVGDIVSLPQLRSKLRLHICNAARVTLDGGPDDRDGLYWDAGAILASQDPVALDVIGLRLIDQARRRVGLGPIGGTSGVLDYITAAASRGLGAGRPHDIELTKLSL